jgi:hypothetical protein
VADAEEIGDLDEANGLAAGHATLTLPGMARPADGSGRHGKCHDAEPGVVVHAGQDFHGRAADPFARATSPACVSDDTRTT